MPVRGVGGEMGKQMLRQGIRDHRDRFPLFHVKDMADRAGAQEMAPVGQGEIDFGTILARARAQGGEHYFVEHDNAQDPLASIRQSYDHLSDLALAS